MSGVRILLHNFPALSQNNGFLVERLVDLFVVLELNGVYRTPTVVPPTAVVVHVFSLVAASNVNVGWVLLHLPELEFNRPIYFLL